MVGWNPQANEIFLRAEEIASPDERQSYVEQACSSDVDLRAAVEALLEASERAGDFLASPPSLATTAVQAAPEGPGGCIGAFKLLEQIGEGGMGLIFMAEQQGALRRRVALKVIKPGMDSRQVIARFEAERQALALMDHPHIAKVFDAGTTESGRPYFVMELVRGIPITEYCDQRKLPVRERLQLFVAVCQAVQHAHQKGIIHRDIKPSNVLVTLHDGTPVPKVIDFGIAKALDQRLTERTLFTQFSQIIGTPQYMSPEQAELSGLDIDTRADVYSLGVLLYELLTGTTPVERKRLESASHHEMCRIIREEEPPRPSARLETLGEALSTVSLQRGLEPQQLSPLVRGELDWIAMKALEKDRTRRYESASSMAADVKRYLNDEPVTACPPSKTYQLRRFARRNRWALATAAVVALALVLGTAVSLWQAVRATRAQNVADDRSRQAEENLHSALDAVERMLLRAGQEGMSQAPQMAQLWSGFYDDALAICQKLMDRETSTPETRYTAARASHLAAGIQHHLGHSVEARRAYQRAINLAGALVAEYPQTTQYQLVLGNAYEDLGISLKRPSGETRAAVADLTEAVTIWKKQHERSPDDLDVLQRLADGLQKLAYCQSADDEFGAAQESYRETFAILDRLASSRADHPSYRRLRAYVGNSLGLMLRSRGRLREAERAFRQALAASDAGGDSDKGEVARGTGHLAITLWLLGQAPEAEQRFREAISVREELVGIYPHWPYHRLELALTCRSSAHFLLTIGKLTAAEEIANKAAETMAKLISEFPAEMRYQVELAAVHRVRANALRDTRRLDEAEKLYDQAVNFQTKWATDSRATADDRLEAAMAQYDLGLLFSARGRAAEARKAYETARQGMERAADGADSGRAAFKHLLARFLASCPDPSLRDVERAVRLASEACLQAPEMGKYSSTLGLAQYRAGAWRSALESLEQRNGLLCGQDLALNHLLKALVYARSGKKADGEPHYGQAVDWFRKHKPDELEFRGLRAETADLFGRSKD